MLRGEVLTHFACENLHLIPTSWFKTEAGNNTEVSLKVTNFRVIISSAVARWSEFDIPLAIIREISNSTNFFDIQTKHVWSFRLFSTNETLLNDLLVHIESKIPKKLQNLFCFTHFEAGQNGNVGTVGGKAGGGAQDSGWGIYNAEAEMKRQCAIDSCAEPGTGTNLLPWFQLVQLKGPQFITYPLSIVVPRRATPQLINQVAKFRQNGRVPSISWVHMDSGGCIARCSQPLVGSRMRSSDDELLLSYLNQSLHANAAMDSQVVPTRAMVKAQIQKQQQTTAPPSLFLDDDDSSPPFPSNTGPVSPSASPLPQQHLDPNVGNNNNSGGSTTPPAPLQDKVTIECEGRKLLILDCRSKAAAAANLANGGGFELVQNYDRCKVVFLGLDNVHSVRSIWDKLTRTVQQERARVSQETSWAKIEGTGWPSLVQQIIGGAHKAAEVLSEGDSVLVHCTDGWDRTSQIISLAMILSDTYYRTIEGICVIIEKEWLQMGHRFADRCGHEYGSDDFVDLDDLVDEPEVGGAPAHKPIPSPVFLQWIDALYQLLKMYPSEFEFTPNFLLFLTDALYSCRFGTFLFNCHRSRFRTGGIVTRTHSVWTEVQRLVEAEQQPLESRNMQVQDRLINPFFNWRRHKTTKATQRRLIPSFHVRKYSYFAAWWNRYDVCHPDQHSLAGTVGLEPEGLHPLMDAMLAHPAMLQYFMQQLQASNNAGGGGAGGATDSLRSTNTTTPTTYSTVSISGRESPPPTRAMWANPNETSTCVVGPTPAKFMFSTRVPVEHLMEEWVTLQNSQNNNSLTCDAQVAADRMRLGDNQYKKRAESSNCHLCNTGFTMFNRRHTCRRCSESMCGGCGSKYISLSKEEISVFEDRDAVGPVRVCNQCFAAWERRNNA